MMLGVVHDVICGSVVVWYVYLACVCGVKHVFYTVGCSTSCSMCK